MTGIVPEEVLAALDRLNGHARAFGCGKSAIYVYKTLAAMLLARASALVARPVETVVDCGYCSGTGRYSGYGPEHRPPCRRCGARGKVRLRFIETTFGRYAWHHPDADGGFNILRAAWGVERYDYEGAVAIAVLADGTRRQVVYEAPGDWTPNRRGERLAAEDAAALLNTVETWVVTVPRVARGEPFWWYTESAIREIGSYHLDLGRIEGPCWRCGRGDDLENIGIGHYGRRLHFALRICKTCYRQEPRVWPTDADLPAHAITPAIRAWLDARRERKPE